MQRWTSIGLFLIYFQFVSTVFPDTNFPFRDANVWQSQFKFATASIKLVRPIFSDYFISPHLAAVV